MAGFKIIVLLVAIQVVCPTPILFKELTLKRNFEFSMKPVLLKPVNFLKAKLEAVAHGHAVAKRSPFQVLPPPENVPPPPPNPPKPPPVLELKSEKLLEAKPLEVIPPPVEVPKKMSVELEGGIPAPAVLPPVLENKAISLAELTNRMGLEGDITALKDGLKPVGQDFKEKFSSEVTKSLELAKSMDIAKSIELAKFMDFQKDMPALHTSVGIPPGSPAGNQPSEGEGGDFLSLLKHSEKEKEGPLVPPAKILEDNVPPQFKVVRPPPVGIPGPPSGLRGGLPPPAGPITPNLPLVPPPPKILEHIAPPKPEVVPPPPVGIPGPPSGLGGGLLPAAGPITPNLPLFLPPPKIMERIVPPKPEVVPPPPVGKPRPPPVVGGGSPSGIQESPIGKLHTDIARVDDINSYLEAVDGKPLDKHSVEENLAVGEPAKSIDLQYGREIAMVKPESVLGKGSRLALYFGNILLQMMSQVINSARSAIGHYSQPAPA